MRAIHLFLIGSLFLAGCHSDSTDSTDPDRPSTFGFGEPATPTALLANPQRLLAPAVGPWQYQVIAGPGSGKSAESRFEQVDDVDYPWRRHTSDQRIEHLGFDAAGNLLMGAVEDLPHQALTIYDPPMVVIPAAMKPGQSLTIESRMTVLNRNDPLQQKDKGDCTKTITYDAEQDVIRPGGPVACRRLSSTYHAKLSLATVDVQSQEWYAENLGLVAEKTDEKIQAMIFKLGAARTLILLEQPK